MITFDFGGKKVGRKFAFGVRRQAERVGRAAALACNEAARIIERRGRQNIRSAGRFGKRWTEGLTATPTIEGNGIIIKVRHAVPYFNIFQYGGVIKGKPLLWIPLSFAQDAKGVRARDYPGRLFRVDRKAGGAPLLLSAEDGQPKYFGKESVTMPKKFRVKEIVIEVSREIRDLYRKHFQGRSKR